MIRALRWVLLVLLLAAIAVGAWLFTQSRDPGAAGIGGDGEPPAEAPADKVGMPEPWGVPRFGRRISNSHLTTYWWVDPDKEATLAAALQDPSITMDPGRREVHFWQLWSAAQNRRAGDAAAGQGDGE